MTSAERCRALVTALQQYRATVCDKYDETALPDVIGRVATAGSLGKADLGALLFWKRVQTGAWVENLLCMADADVRRITAQSVAAARNLQLPVPDAARLARQALLDLPGAKSGDAFASAVILVGAPDRMAVYDYHAHLGLWRAGLRLVERPGLYFEYMKLVEQCRAELLQHRHGEWTARQVDLALFTYGEHRGLPRPRPWS